MICNATVIYVAYCVLVITFGFSSNILLSNVSEDEAPVATQQCMLGPTVSKTYLYHMLLLIIINISSAFSLS